MSNPVAERMYAELQAATIEAMRRQKIAKDENDARVKQIPLSYFKQCGLTHVLESDPPVFVYEAPDPENATRILHLHSITEL